MDVDYESQRAWNTATQLVRGATERSQFNETSEAIFMNSGYVYATAEGAGTAKST